MLHMDNDRGWIEMASNREGRRIAPQDAHGNCVPLRRIVIMKEDLLVLNESAAYLPADGNPE